MKHCCHCHFKEQLHKFKAGKLGLLGGFLVVGHLLFHVAECLVLPALFVALHPHDVEATDELTAEEISETTFTTSFSNPYNLHANFFDTLNSCYPLKR